MVHLFLLNINPQVPQAGVLLVQRKSKIGPHWALRLRGYGRGKEEREQQLLFDHLFQLSNACFDIAVNSRLTYGAPLLTEWRMNDL